MRIHDIRTLYDYNAWANARVLDAAARVPTAQFATASLGRCNLRGTLEHILDGEVTWRLRWQGIAPELAEFPAEFSTLEAMRTRWREEDRQLDAFLATLGDAHLDRQVTYEREGTRISRTLWHMLVHVVSHGTQHRAEVALLLTELGCSPGDLDFTVFVREHQA